MSVLYHTYNRMPFQSKVPTHKLRWSFKKVLIFSVSEKSFLTCRRGREWHYLQWNNTITYNHAEWTRYESTITTHFQVIPFPSLFPSGTKYISNTSCHPHFALCVFLEVTTESNDATETNGGLISFKQWVTGAAPDSAVQSGRRGQAKLLAVGAEF